MRGTVSLIPFLLANFGLLLVPVCARAEFFAASHDGELFTIDEATAGATIIRDAIGYDVRAMAMGPSGTVYMAGRNLLMDREFLITIERATGLTGPGPGLFRWPSAIAFSPDGTLFAVESQDPNDQVYTIDAATGAETPVGGTGLPGITGLEFGPEGTLYGWDMGDASCEGGLGLVTIDRVTGVATDVDPAVNAPVGGPSAVATLAFAPDGTLYGANDSLFKVAIKTGALELVGSLTHGNVRGMVWIPEPSTLVALLSMGAMVLLAYVFVKLIES